MSIQTTYVWLDCLKLVAQRSDQPDVILVIDLPKSDETKGLFFITDIQRANQALVPYTGRLSACLKATVEKYFNILEWGGYLYTQDENGKLHPRITAAIMVNSQEFILRLQSGVEEQWPIWQYRSDLAPLLQHLLTK